jgi:hypothetical protein
MRDRGSARTPARRHRAPAYGTRPFTAVRASRGPANGMRQKDGGKERHRATDLVTIVPARTPDDFRNRGSATMGSMSVARRAGT